MLWGYAATVVLISAAMALSVRPLSRSGRGGVVSWLLTMLANESPPLVVGYFLLATVATLPAGPPWETGVAWWAVIGCAALGLTLILVKRSAAASAVLDEALTSGLGPHRTSGDPSGTERPRRRLTRAAWCRIILCPVPVRPFAVRRLRHAYGPHRRHRADVYCSKRRTGDLQPIVIHLHGGGFTSGCANVYARPLLHAFARQGWVCISASYRLRPTPYRDIRGDVERLLDWTQRNARRWGADPDRIVLAGSSAGAHLALTTALAVSAQESSRSPVVAVVGLYGYYGAVDDQSLEHGSTPSQHAHPHAPPVMLVHGDQDTLVASSGAARLSRTLSSVSSSPVVYAELPGAQHNFDLLHSVRFELVIKAIGDFCAWAVARPQPQAPADERKGTSARNGDAKTDRDG